MSLTVDKHHLFYEALAAQYEAKIKECLATLSVYFTNPVGIGEHPQHLEEMDKLMEELSTAQDKLDNLRHYFKPSGDVNGKSVNLNGKVEEKV